MAEESTEQDQHPEGLDPLTGLHVQEYLIKEITRVLERSRQGELPATLALLQLENFYEIRTWVGKSEANLLLSDIARLLKSCLPDSALVAQSPFYRSRPVGPQDQPDFVNGAVHLRTKLSPLALLDELQAIEPDTSTTSDTSVSEMPSSAVDAPAATNVSMPIMCMNMVFTLACDVASTRR